MMLKNDDRVPTKYPYGGITDEEYHCARCGENLTGCEACAGMERAVVRSAKFPNNGLHDRLNRI